VIETVIAWSLSRAAVIAIAVLGGLAALVAMGLRRRGAAPLWTRRLDQAAYALMATSMLLFIISGLRGPQH
jgi:hypothetical protein